MHRSPPFPHTVAVVSTPSQLSPHPRRRASSTPTSYVKLPAPAFRSRKRIEYKSHVLESIPNNFSEQNKVGSGSYGAVYKMSCVTLTGPRVTKSTCEGLNHLHSAHDKPIYHMDLKPSNILLDVNRTAKIQILVYLDLLSQHKLTKQREPTSEEHSGICHPNT